MHDIEVTYLDHAGMTLYSRSLIDAFSLDLTANLLGNPHSASSSSVLTVPRIDNVRLRVLQWFNADPNEFDVVFVANATAGIKLVMEGFREHRGGFWYGYHRDSHTSLVGVRECARAGHHCFMTDTEVETWLDSRETDCTMCAEDTTCLFAYPAQSNMNGRRLPLSWPRRLRSNSHGKHTYSLLDAAALVSTSPLDLSDTSVAPDFTVLSFYKIFGFPDLGALVVRREAAAPLLRRSYFGGGTVDIVTCGQENWHIKKQGSIHEQLEDGTLPIHSIVALDIALKTHARLFVSIDRVSNHASYLALRLYRGLSAFRHHNRKKVCEIYKDPLSSYENSKTQGPMVAFNLRNSEAGYVSNTEVEKLANIKNIQLRSGSLCNPGGIASSLGLAPWEMKRNFAAGHRCGNEIDLVGGKPTSMLRASLGAMSNAKDIQNLLQFIDEFFVEKASHETRAKVDGPRDRELFVSALTIYPIKSCGGWSIPDDVCWDVREEGLAWDREWCLVHGGTHQALSQKRYPQMALLRPCIDTISDLLRVRFHGPLPRATPSEISVPLSDDPNAFVISAGERDLPPLQICGDEIRMKTYASKDIADFFSNAIGTPCTLARFPAATSIFSQRHSKTHLQSSLEGDMKRPPILFSNESPILTISRSSLNCLNKQIKQRDGKAAHASVFRANIVIGENTPPGCERPYVEDTWSSLRVGNNVNLDVIGPCRRCQMVCVDQSTAEKNEEPFVTLAKTRRKLGKVYFGVHTSLSTRKDHHYPEIIKTGDKVIPVLSEAAPGGICINR